MSSIAIKDERTERSLRSCWLGCPVVLPAICLQRQNYAYYDQANCRTAGVTHQTRPQQPSPDQPSLALSSALFSPRFLINLFVKAESKQETTIRRIMSNKGHRQQQFPPLSGFRFDSSARNSNRDSDSDCPCSSSACPWVWAG